MNLAAAKMENYLEGFNQALVNEEWRSKRR
jgi:hypothetical protein